MFKKIKKFFRRKHRHEWGEPIGCLLDHRTQENIGRYRKCIHCPQINVFSGVLDSEMVELHEMMLRDIPGIENIPMDSYMSMADCSVLRKSKLKGDVMNKLCLLIGFILGLFAVPLRNLILWLIEMI